MPTGRPNAELLLTEEERIQLSSLARSRTLPHAIVVRAKVILRSAEGASNSEIADRLQSTSATVGNCGVVSWKGARRVCMTKWPGRPRSIEGEQVAALLKRTLTRKPKGRNALDHPRSGTGQRNLQINRSPALSGFAIQPHRSRSFKPSTDPFFVEKVRDIAGLYLNPPDHALVLCVDETIQIQALNRTQPVLSMGLGYVEGLTHDYVRHGTTNLFAALDIATGAVFTECKPRHRHQQFLRFFADWTSAFRRNSMFI